MLPITHFVFKKSECKKVCLDIDWSIFYNLHNVQYQFQPGDFIGEVHFTKSIAICDPKLSYFKSHTKKVKVAQE